MLREDGDGGVGRGQFQVSAFPGGPLEGTDLTAIAESERESLRAIADRGELDSLVKCKTVRSEVSTACGSGRVAPIDDWGLPINRRMEP